MKADVEEQEQENHEQEGCVVGEQGEEGRKVVYVKSEFCSSFFFFNVKIIWNVSMKEIS